jgi:hypothetical protein
MMFLLELRIPLGTKRGAPVAAFPPDPGFSQIVIGSDMRSAPVLRTGANSLARECPIWVMSCPSARQNRASGMRARSDIRPRASAMHRIADLRVAGAECPSSAMSRRPMPQPSAVPSMASCWGADCEALWLAAQVPKFSSWIGTIFGRTVAVLASRTILGQLASSQAVPCPGQWESIHT